MAPPELRSPVTRAVVPVLGGVVVLAIIAAFTWAIAVYASRGGADSSERLAPTSFTIGNAESLAKTVATEGPLLFPELGTAIGTRSIVVNHTGDDPIDNWRVYWAYPADRPAACLVEQVPKSSDFIDCEGRQISVEQLAPPDAGVFPRIEDRKTLVIDLRGTTTVTTTSG